MKPRLPRLTSSSSRRGGALIAVTIFILLAVIVAVVALTTAKARRETVLLQKARAEAYNAAEVGLRVALAKLNDKGNPNVNGDVSAMRSEATSPTSESTGSFDLFTEVTDPSGQIYKSPFSSSADSSAPKVAGQDQDQDGFLDFAPGSSWKEQVDSFRKEPTGRFAVRARNLGGATTRGTQELRAFGVSNGYVRVVAAVGTPQSFENGSSVPGTGFYAGESFSGAGNVLVDSYSSDNGRYGASYTDADGNTQTNTAGNVTIGSNGGVDISGGSFTLNGKVGSGEGSGSVNAPGIDSSKIIPDALPEVSIPTPDTTPPAGLASSGAFADGGPPGSTTVLGTAGSATTVRYDSMAIKRTVKVVGDVTIYVTGDFTMNATGGLAIDRSSDPNSKVTIKVAGQVTVNGASVSNPSQPPEAVRIETSTTGLVKFNGTADFTGVLVAPQATVQTNGTLDFFGAMFAKTFKASGTAKLHYDEALKIGGDPSSSDPVDFQMTATYEITKDPAALESEHGSSGSGN